MNRQRQATIRRAKPVAIPSLPDVPGSGGVAAAVIVAAIDRHCPSPTASTSSRETSSCAGSDSQSRSPQSQRSAMISSSRLPSSLSTFHQNPKPGNRNSTGSTASSQASSGFESAKNLFANSNSSGSFSSSTFESPPPNAADTLRRLPPQPLSRPKSEFCQMFGRTPQVAEMMSRGVADAEILSEWLEGMGMPQYLNAFVSQGYDVASVFRLTSEDLLALGITDPQHRRLLHNSLREWALDEEWPPLCHRDENTLVWLSAIGLQQYSSLFENEGYNKIRDLEKLNFEDLEDMGIKKLGHIKRLTLGIRRLKKANRGLPTPPTIPSTSKYSHSNFPFDDRPPLTLNIRPVTVNPGIMKCRRNTTYFPSDYLYTQTEQPNGKELYSTRQILSQTSEPPMFLNGDLMNFSRLNLEPRPLPTPPTPPSPAPKPAYN